MPDMYPTGDYDLAGKTSLPHALKYPIKFDLSKPYKYVLIIIVLFL